MIENASFALDWMMTSGTCAPSLALCAAVCGRTPKDRSHPTNPDDFGRCMVLLRDLPQARCYLYLAAKLSSDWARLVAHWTDVEQCFVGEVGTSWECSSQAIQTGLLLQQIFSGQDTDTQEQFS